MDANDVSEQIRAAVETERAEHRAVERFRTRGAMVIAVLAMLLAIASLGGENATKEMISANIHASDSWAFYQAKNIRQTVNQLAADELEATLLLHAAMLTDEARQQMQRRIERYRATVAIKPKPKTPTLISRRPSSRSPSCWAQWPSSPLPVGSYGWH